MALCATLKTIYTCTTTICMYPTPVSVYVSSEMPATGCEVANLLDPTEYSQLMAALASSVGSFDYVQAAAIFSFFFSFVVGVWFVSKNIGLVLNAIKRW